MTKAETQTESGGLPGGLLKRILFPVLMILWITTSVFLGINATKPPKALPAGTAATEFSLDRALKHVEVIASHPHPIGSAEHDRVRDYIMQELAAAGITPEIQKASTTGSGGFAPIMGASIENIIGILKGSEPGKAVMLVSHYDSAVNSPGASDDGCAVASLLECLRVLKASPPLKNDVIFLFTDGEEEGLFGAKAFVTDNPLVSQVGLVLNFEARGNRGPSIMFETSPENGRLIPEFAKASPFPVANSLSYAIYKRLPNDTDMTVFKRHGLAGLNFAYIEGLSHYHSGKDDIESVDPSSLQHHGTYAVALAKHFGSLDLDSLKAPDVIYFNVIGSTLVYYSKVYEKILVILTTLMGLLAYIIGFRRKHLTSSGMLVGSLMLLANLLLVSIIIRAAWQTIRTFHRWDGLMTFAVTDRLGYFVLGLAALAIAINVYLYLLPLKRLTAENLLAGTTLVWFLLMLLSSIFQPDISYIFTWPLLPIFCGMVYIFYSDNRELPPVKRFITLAAMSLPALILVSPMIYFISFAAGEGAIWIPTLLVSLLIGLLIPQFDLIGQMHKLLIPIGALLACVIVLVVALRGADFNSENPKPDHLFYGVDADKQKAVWASADRWPDDWTSQFILASPQREGLQEFFPARFLSFLESEAPVAKLPSPDIKVLEDHGGDGIRRLHLRIMSMRQAPILMLRANSTMEVLAVSIAGKPVNLRTTPLSLNPDDPWLLRYYGLPKEGLDLSLEVRSSAPIQLRAIDQSYGLAQIEGLSYKERPNYLVPSSIFDSDSSFVGKSFTF